MLKDIKISLHFLKSKTKKCDYLPSFFDGPALKSLCNVKDFCHKGQIFYSLASFVNRARHPP